MQVSMQTWAFLFPRWSEYQSSLMHSQAASLLTKEGQRLCRVTAVQRRRGGQGRRVRSHVSWPESFRWLTFPKLLLLPPEEGSGDGWMAERIEGTRWEISFPICHVSAASASVSFSHLIRVRFKLISSSPAEYLPYQHVSISVSRG